MTVSPKKMQSKAAPTRREPLSRERIELAALVLIDKEGLEGFSVRKLGDMLGCEAMSIYHHFLSKAHIIDALVDRLVSRVPIPSHDLDSVERLRGLANGWRNMARQNPRFFPVLSLHRLNSEVGVTFLNEVMLTFRAGGLERERAARLFRVMNYYLMGAALDEISGYAKGPSSLNPMSNHDLTLKFPHIADAGEFFAPEQFDQTFELGLNLLMEGAGLL